MKKYRIRENSPLAIIKNTTIISIGVIFLSAPSAIESLFLGGCI